MQVSIVGCSNLAIVMFVSITTTLRGLQILVLKGYDIIYSFSFYALLFAASSCLLCGLLKEGGGIARGKKGTRTLGFLRFQKQVDLGIFILKFKRNFFRF